jgi:CheY-like chemotaxis protein
VLIIDDEARSRNALADAVREAGFTAEVAESGPSGLQMARTRPPDAIVLDVIMPEQDGWSVLQEIKGDDRLCEIPVVLATVLADREMGLAFGAVDHLVKPIDAQKLLATLGTIIGGDHRDVLIVDDDPATRALCRRVLTREGWDVREAANGVRGLAQIEARKPDLLLLDLMMPEMDGFELLSEIHSRPELAGLAIIVITSKDLTRDEVDWLQKRTSDVVQKGQSGRADLVTALKRHMARERTA